MSIQNKFVRLTVAFGLTVAFLVAGSIPLSATVPTARAADSIELFWWGARIGESWGNAWNHADGHRVPHRLEISGQMETATPPLTSWEDVDIFVGWRQVFFRTPAGQLFELRSPTHNALDQTAGEITQIPLSPHMQADGVASWNDVEIVAGNMHVFARTLDGSRLYAWGRNTYGQLGLGPGHPNYVTVPTRVPGLTGFPANDWTGVEIMPGIDHTLARTPVGGLFGWGHDGRGELMQSTMVTSRPTPVSINIAGSVIQSQGGAANWNDVEIFSLASSTLVRTQNGMLFGWGQGNMGQLAQNLPNQGIDASAGNNINRNIAVQIHPSAAMTTRRGVDSQFENMDIITHVGINRTFARCQTTGYMFAWGQNDAGQAGVYPLGVVTPPTNPPSYIQIGTPTLVPFPNTVPTIPTYIPTQQGVLQWNNVELIAGAGHCFALTPCGRLFVWGNNASGQLGANLPTTPSPGNNPRLPFPIEVPLLQTMQDAGMESWNDIILVPGFVTNFALMRSPGVPLVKTLEMPEGTTVPASRTFTFAFERVQVQLADNPVRLSREVAHVPQIANQTVTVDISTLETTGGITTVTGSMNLRPLIMALDFDGRAGVFVWEVRELPQVTPPLGAGAGTMLFDESRFQLRAYVGRDGTVILNVHSLQYQNGNWVLVPDSKPNAIEFTNHFRINVTNALEVRKNVTGANADLNTPFTFQLNLVGHTLAPLPPTVNAQVIAVGGAITSVTINTANLPHEFTLRHGERFLIPALYAGTTWNVTELERADFLPEVEVLVGSVSVFHYESNVPRDLSTENRLIHDTGRNVAYFINDHQWDVPTGLVINNISIAVPLAAAAMLVLLLASKRRRSIEEMPLMH